MTRSSSRQFARFLAAGAVNSGLTYLLYLALLPLVSYQVAYSASYVAGTFCSFVVNSRFVFGVPLRWRRLLPYPAVYGAQYLLGLGVMHVGVERLGWNERLMPIAVLALTVPVSFVLTGWVLAEKEGRDARDPRAPRF